jgi:hypothetical protein
VSCNVNLQTSRDMFVRVGTINNLENYFIEISLELPNLSTNARLLYRNTCGAPVKRNTFVEEDITIVSELIIYLNYL